MEIWCVTLCFTCVEVLQGRVMSGNSARMASNGEVPFLGRRVGLGEVICEMIPLTEIWVRDSTKRSLLMSTSNP